MTSALSTGADEAGSTRGGGPDPTPSVDSADVIQTSCCARVKRSNSMESI